MTVLKRGVPFKVYQDKGTILFKPVTYGGHSKLTAIGNTHNKTCESLRLRVAILFRGTIESV